MTPSSWYWRARVSIATMAEWSHTRDPMKSMTTSRPVLKASVAPEPDAAGWSFSFPEFPAEASDPCCGDGGDDSAEEWEWVDERPAMSTGGDEAFFSRSRSRFCRVLWCED